jgi:hypothetical protein
MIYPNFKAESDEHKGPVPTALRKWDAPAATVSRVVDITKSSPNVSGGYDGSTGSTIYSS